MLGTHPWAQVQEHDLVAKQAQEEMDRSHKRMEREVANAVRTRARASLAFRARAANSSAAQPHDSHGCRARFAPGRL
jgi:hypothetical protein